MQENQKQAAQSTDSEQQQQLIVETTMVIKGEEVPIGRILERALGEMLTKGTRYEQLLGMVAQINLTKSQLSRNLEAYKTSVAGAEMDAEQRAIFDNNVKIAEVKLGLLDIYMDQATKFRQEHETALATVVTVPHVELINGLTEAVDEMLVKKAEAAAAAKAEPQAQQQQGDSDAPADVKADEAASTNEVPADEAAAAPAPAAASEGGVELSSKNAPAPAAPEVLTLGGAKSE